MNRSVSNDPSNLWLRLQGFGDRGRDCATYGTRPCNLKTRLIDSFCKQPAGEKDYAQQDVNAVVGLAEIQRSHVPHPVGSSSKRHSQNTEREINHAEDQRKHLCCRQSACKAKIQCENTRE